MDKIYLRKTIKLMFAVPLAYCLMLVLDIDVGSDFLGLLLVYMSIWLFPDPIGLKKIILLKILWIGFLFLLAGAFTAALWGINSIVIFIYILLTGLGVLIWMPSEITTGNLCTGVYIGLLALTSTRPYTQAVYYFIVIAIGIVVGWSTERLFWPIFDQQGIEKQVSKTFLILQDLSDRAFQATDLSSARDDVPLQVLTGQADSSMRATMKALKIASMTGSLSPTDRDIWAQAIAIQGKLLAHLSAISQFFQDNRDNPLLQELDPELPTLGCSLSETFAGLSRAMVSQQAAGQLPNPSFDLQHLQTRLKEMREVDISQSFDLRSHLAIGLIEHGLESLVTDLTQTLTWQEKRRFTVQ